LERGKKWEKAQKRKKLEGINRSDGERKMNRTERGPEVLGVTGANLEGRNHNCKRVGTVKTAPKRGNLKRFKKKSGGKELKRGLACPENFKRNTRYQKSARKEEHGRKEAPKEMRHGEKLGSGKKGKGRIKIEERSV